MEKKRISVEIDGVVYTPIYNFNTMAKFSERHSLSIDDFTKMTEPSLRHLIDLCWLGIQEYCRINKMELPFDVHRIGELDTDTVSLLIQSISANMMPLPKDKMN